MKGEKRRGWTVTQDPPTQFSNKIDATVSYNPNHNINLQQSTTTHRNEQLISNLLQRNPTHEIRSGISSGLL
jgi:hypothetical protein